MNSAISKNKETKNLKSTLFQRSSGLLNNIINLSGRGRSSKGLTQEIDTPVIHYENVYSTNLGFNQMSSNNSRPCNELKSRSELDITELKDNDFSHRSGNLPVNPPKKLMEKQNALLYKSSPSQSKAHMPNPRNPNVIVLSKRKLHQSTKSLSTLTISSNKSGTSSPVRPQFISSSKLSLCTSRQSLSQTDTNQQVQLANGHRFANHNNQERTPVWITSIFRLVKEGKLGELKNALLGLESGLIRHLVDSEGNTLLHVAAQEDNVEALTWIIQLLKQNGLSEQALNDRNKAGRTVLLTSLKKRSMKCLKWLVENTQSGEEEFLPSDGRQSLLHYAARYDNTEGITWLSRKICSRNLSVDIRDSSGQTPLHVASTYGKINASHFLIRFGADPFCQTELGLRPLDLALRHCRLECSHYFIMVETAGSMEKELKDLMELSQISHHYQLLQFHFREILQVGKTLLKERSDLIKGAVLPKSLENPEPPIPLSYGSPPNIRLSEIEHKLLASEQSFKEIVIEINKSFKASEEMEFPMNEFSETQPTSILIMKMTKAESLRDKNFLVELSKHAMASSQEEKSDEDSTCSISSREDESAFFSSHSYHNIRQSNDWRKDKSDHVQITSTKESLSSPSKPKITGTSPWLLSDADSTTFPSTFHIKDSKFIQPLKNIDFLQSPCFKKSSGSLQHGMDETGRNSLEDVSMDIDGFRSSLSKSNGQQPQSFVTTQALDASVLEVIEPVLPKEISLAPDLIQQTSSSLCPLSLDSHQSDGKSDSNDHSGHHTLSAATKACVITSITPRGFSSFLQEKKHINRETDRDGTSSSLVNNTRQHPFIHNGSASSSFSNEVKMNDLKTSGLNSLSPDIEKNSETQYNISSKTPEPQTVLLPAELESCSIDYNEYDDDGESIAPSETSKTESTIATAIPICVGGVDINESTCGFESEENLLTTPSGDTGLHSDSIRLKGCVLLSNEPSYVDDESGIMYLANEKNGHSDPIPESEKLHTIFPHFNIGNRNLMILKNPKDSCSHLSKKYKLEEQKAWYELDGSEGSDDESSLLRGISQSHSPHLLSSEHSRGCENEQGPRTGDGEDEELLGTMVNFEETGIHHELV